MRPADFGLPNYCVHRLAMQDVAQLLVQGPAMVYYEDIGQAVLAFLLALLLLVQASLNSMVLKVPHQMMYILSVCPFAGLFLAFGGLGRLLPTKHNAKAASAATNDEQLLHGHGAASADEF
jgi:hypothetical protein